MPRSTTTPFLLSLSFSLFLSSPLLAQPDSDLGDRFSSILTEANGDYLITFDTQHGTPLTDFVDLAQAITKKTFDFDADQCGAIRLHCRGTMTIPKERFWSTFQSVLRAYDFVVVPYGNVSAPGQPSDGPETGLFAIRRSSGGAGGAKPGYIKSQAPIVEPAELAAYRHDPGVVLTTSFQLEHVHCQEAVNMLQTYFTDPMLESVRAVNQSNSIVVTGFAQTLAGISDLLTQIDVARPVAQQQLARIPLQHAVALEVMPILTDLAGLGQPPQVHGGARAPAVPEASPRIEPDPRTNALLVLATPEQVRRIRQYVTALDVAVDATDAVDNTRVHALKHAPANELVELLSLWAQRNGLNRPGVGSVSFVPVSRTNSVLVTCPPDQWAALEALIQELDASVGE